MPNIKFTEFPSATVVGSMDIIPIVQDGINKKTTAAVFQTYIGSLFVGLAGTQTITGSKTFTSPIISNVAIGTAPFSVVSTTKVTNLNADLLDGLSSAAFQSALTLTTTGTSGAATLVGATLNIPQYQSVLTNPITGTGTTNYLPKFTGASALGNSLIYDSGSNVYLNTTSGTYRFEANAGSSQYINARFYGSSHSLLQIESTTAGFQALFSFKSPTRTWSMGLQGDGRFNIYDNTANAERFTITSAGNVGIGSTTPSEILDVRNINREATNGEFTQLLSSTNSQDAGIGASLGFGGFTNGTSGYTTFSGLKGFKENGDGGNTAGALAFYTRVNAGAISERMRITSAGNIGIGTSTPQAKLHSNADILTGYFQNGTNGIYDALKLTNNTGNNTLSGNGARIQFYNNSNNSTNLLGSSIRSVNTDYGWASDLILSSVRNNSYTTQTAIDVLTLSSSGNATFIGEVSAVTRFRLNPTTQSNQIIGDGTASNLAGANNLLLRNDSGSIFFASGGANVQMLLNTSGNLLLNTSTDIASSKLTIESTTQGVLVPRMTTTQINAIGSPANGLIAYNTTLAVLCFYDGSGWRKVSHSSM